MLGYAESVRHFATDGFPAPSLRKGIRLVVDIVHESRHGSAVGDCASIDMKATCSHAVKSAEQLVPRHRLRGQVVELGNVEPYIGQALGRNAPCKDAVRRAQLELGMDVSASTAAFCKARGRVSASTLEAMSARLSAEADLLCGLAWRLR